MRWRRPTLPELLLAIAALTFAGLFLLAAGHGAGTTRTRVRTVVRVLPQSGVAVGERSFALNLPQGQHVFPDPSTRELPGSHPPNAQTTLSYMVGGTLVQVISARLDATTLKVPVHAWVSHFRMPYAIDKRPYSVQGQPGYLYVNRTLAYMQLVAVFRVKAQVYMVMVGDPLPATERQELPKLAEIVHGLNLHPNTKPLPAPSFAQVCAGARYQLAHHTEQDIKLSAARDRVREVCNRHSAFWKTSPPPRRASSK